MGLEKEKTKTTELSDQDIKNKGIEEGMKYIMESIQGAPIEQKEQIKIASENFLRNPTEENFNAAHTAYTNYFDTLAKNDPSKFNALRKDAGLTVIHAKEPALMHVAANELAVKKLKDANDLCKVNIKLLSDEEKLKKMNDPEGAERMEEMRKELNKFKNKEERDVFLQEQKTKLIEEGRTDLAALVGEAQELSKTTWSEMSKWKPPSAMKDLVPAVLMKHAGEYAAKLMKNIDDYIKEYLKKSASMFDGKEITAEEKKTLAHELEEAQKAKEELEKKEGSKKEFEKNFEKYLKQELTTMQNTITDESVMDMVKKLNSDISKLTSEDLMLENMHPSVTVGVVKAYRKAAVDTARAIE